MSDLKKEIEFDKKMKHKHAKSENAVGHALLMWDKDNKTLLLHTVLRAWCDDVTEEREMDARAAKLAEQAAIKKEHDQKMEYVLLKMEGDNKSFIQQYGYNAWRDYVQEKKHLGTGSELERQVALYKEMHRADVRKLMYKLVSADDNTT